MSAYVAVGYRVSCDLPGSLVHNVRVMLFYAVRFAEVFSRAGLVCSVAVCASGGFQPVLVGTTV